MIMRDMLTSLREPHIVTHIMYSTNLSYKQLKVYLELLIKNNLIEEYEFEKNQRRFRTTNKGLTFFDLITPKDNLIQFKQAST